MDWTQLFTEVAPWYGVVLALLGVIAVLASQGPRLISGLKEATAEQAKLSETTRQTASLIGKEYGQLIDRIEALHDRDESAWRRELELERKERAQYEKEMEANLAARNEERNKLSVRVKALEKALDEAVNAASVSNQKADERIKQLEAENARLQGEIGKLKEENKRLHTELEDIKKHGTGRLGEKNTDAK